MRRLAAICRPVEAGERETWSDLVRCSFYRSALGCSRPGALGSTSGVGCPETKLDLRCRPAGWSLSSPSLLRANLGRPHPGSPLRAWRRPHRGGSAPPGRSRQTASSAQRSCYAWRFHRRVPHLCPGDGFVSPSFSSPSPRTSGCGSQRDVFGERPVMAPGTTKRWRSSGSAMCRFMMLASRSQSPWAVPWCWESTRFTFRRRDNGGSADRDGVG